MITGVSKIIVPVADEEIAKQFWVGQLGFELMRDESYGPQKRWIEIATPDRSVLLVLSRRRNDEPRREVPDDLPHSPVFFRCVDIEQTHRVLTERGVRFALPPVRMPFGWWSMFEDPEGTRYALSEM